MITENKEQGYYCTICQTTYANWGNIPTKCWKGQCKRNNKKDNNPN